MSLITPILLSVGRNVRPKICRVLYPSSEIHRNYWRRRDMFSDLSTAVQSIENYMREMDKEMNRVFKDFQRVSPVKFPPIFSSFDADRVRDIPVVSTDGDSRSYKLELDMEGMKPEDIHITLRSNELTVTARRDEKREDGSRFVKENSYHYTLPNQINPDTIRSSLTNGVLTIEAPLPAIESKEIPVTIENGRKSSSDSNEKNK